MNNTFQYCTNNLCRPLHAILTLQTSCSAMHSSHKFNSYVGKLMYYAHAIGVDEHYIFREVFFRTNLAVQLLTFNYKDID